VSVLAALPSPRQSVVLGGIFLNVRGLFLPVPSIDPWLWLIGALLGALIPISWFARRPGRMAALWLPPALILAWAIGAGATARWEVPTLQGFNFSGGVRLPPELLALWLGVSIYTSAFISEAMRGAILGVPHVQSEAAGSLGLSRTQTMFLIILPQALRLLVPPLTSNYLNIIKSTTLGAAIAYPDVLQIFGRTVLNQSGRAVEVMTLLLSAFLVINLITSSVMNRWNQRLALQGR
jgi:general L-amino acid transport system permease protein